jgi:SAM-dependent methyltransferase
LKEIIEHVADPRSLVEGAVRLLRGDGLLLAHVPTPYSQLYPVANFWDDYTHVRPFTRLALHHLMEDCGMRVAEIRGYVGGRNGLERTLARVLGRLAPHVYRVIAVPAAPPHNESSARGG